MDTGACLHDDKLPAKSGFPAPEMGLPVTHSSPIELLGFPTGPKSPLYCRVWGYALTAAQLRCQPYHAKSMTLAGCCVSLAWLCSHLSSCLVFQKIPAGQLLLPWEEVICVNVNRTSNGRADLMSVALYAKRQLEGDRCNHLRNLERWPA